MLARFVKLGRPQLSLGLLLCMLTLNVGCSKYRTAPVSGVITLDDQPLVDATVTFSPLEAVEGENPTSTGRTDSSGKYVLKLMTDNSNGAILGKHTVRIARNIESTSDIMTKEEERQSYLPPYDFSFEVVSVDNQANFNLVSKGGRR